MGAREDLANLGIVNAYDAATVALKCDLPPVWIDRIAGDVNGWKVSHLIYKIDAGQRLATDQQIHHFGDWQYHSKEHGLIAAQSFAARLAKDAAFVKITGLGAPLFPAPLDEMLKKAKREWRKRGGVAHRFARTDDIGRANWPYVIDPCNCGLARIAQVHRGG